MKNSIALSCLLIQFIFPLKAQEIWLEAECADVGNNWATVSDFSASGGQGVSTNVSSVNTPPSNSDNYISFNVDIAQDATYQVYGRVLASSTSNNALWIRANGGTWYKWDNIPISNSISYDPPRGKLPVVPGAVGFGMYGKAGRGGKVLKVTNLNDSGTGSLRWALEQSGPRVVIFEVSGRINLRDEITILNPYLTIAGQTAPDPGILITGSPLEVGASEVLIQHISIYAGDDPDGREYDNRDCITIGKTGYEVRNVVLDHVSLGWGTDENIDIIEDTDNISLRHVLIAEPLVATRSNNRNAGYGLLVYGRGSLDITGSYLAHVRQRSPLTRIGNLVFVNNVLYDRQQSWITMGNANGSGNPDGSTSNSTYVGNVFTEGPSLSSGTEDLPITVMNKAPLNRGSLLYVEDNYWSKSSLNSQWDLVKNEPSYARATSPPTWVEGLVAKSDINEIEDWVLQNVGARPAVRGPIDERILNNYVTQQGGLKDCVEGCSNNTGGWPKMANNRRSLTVPNDPSGDDDNNGYTNLEEWLHSFSQKVEGAQIGYGWDDAHDSNNNDQALSFDLVAGNNTIEIATCEPGVTVDKLLLSDNPISPSGKGENATNCTVDDPVDEDCQTPVGWTSSDIGSVGLAGSVCDLRGEGIYQIKASGSDIWRSADEFHFLYQTLSGDGEIIARVNSIDYTNDWAKAGVMIRNSLSEGARNAMMYISPTGRWSFQRRTVDDDRTFSTASDAGAISTPRWVRLVRQGNQITGYHSGNGTDWILVGSELIPLDGEVLIGLAVTSHNNSIINQSELDQVQIIDYSEVNNTPPTFSTSGDIITDEDFTGTRQLLITPDPVPAEEEGQIPLYLLSPTIDSVRFAFLDFDKFTGTLTVTAKRDTFGTQNFTITATDGQVNNSTHTETFTLQINPVNDEPSFVIDRDSINVLQDFSSTEKVIVTLDTIPNNELDQNISFSLSPATVDFADISIDPATGEVTITAIPFKNGIQEFLITADDGQISNNIFSQKFVLNVIATGTPPFYSVSGDINVDEDFETAQVVTVTPDTVLVPEEDRAVVYILNPSSVPFATIDFNNTTGQVTFNAIPDAYGTQTFTLTAVNQDGITYGQSFRLNVNSVNDPPTFTGSGDINVNEDFPITAFYSANTAFITGEEGETYTFSIEPQTISFANLNFDQATGEALFTSIPDSSGTQQFVITANDGNAQNNISTDTFTLVVAPINDQPSFTLSGDISVIENFTTTETVSLTADPTPQDEAGEVIIYSISPESVAFANINFDTETGETQITSVPEAFGEQLFTVTATDSADTSSTYTQTFNLLVSRDNNPPTFTVDSLLQLEEDFSGVSVITLVPDAVDPLEQDEVVIYSLSPSTVEFATIAFDSTTGVISISAIANGNGNQTFTITADDGQAFNNSFSETFILDINPVNDAPAFGSIADIDLPEDFSPAYLVEVIIAAVPADEQGQNVTYSLEPASIDFANVSLDALTGAITFTPTADATGSQTFTLTADDGQGENNTFSRSFTFTVNAQNDRPEFTLSGNVTVAEDFTTTEVVNVNAAPAPLGEEGQLITYSISPASVSFANIDFDPATGQVNITSVPNGAGTQEFLITADDGQAANNTYTQVFTLTVLGQNDAPVFSLSGDINVNEDFNTTELVTVSPATVPADEAGQSVSYGITPSSVSFANVNIDPATGQVTITSVLDGSGTQVFTITANDGQSSNNLHAETFTLTVVEVNDPPNFTLSGDVVVPENFTTTEQVLVTPGAVAASETGQVVTYSLSPASVDFANVSINSATGLVSITAATDQSGEQTFTITADDGEANNNTFSQTFTLTVVRANEAPSFVLSGDISVDEDFSSTEQLILTPDPVSPEEQDEVVIYSIEPQNIDFADMIFDPATGNVSFTSIAELSGTQSFTITANDGKLFNNTFSASFTFTVNSVNDAPIFNTSGDITVNEDFGGIQTLNITPGAVPANEASQNVVYTLSPTNISFANLAFDPGTGEVSFSSIPDANGSQVFTITADDGQGQNNLHQETFTFTVNPMNDAPSFSISGDILVPEDFTTTEVVNVIPGTVPLDEVSQEVVYSLSPQTVGFANVNFDSNTGTVSFTSIPDANGTQVFTITANDGQGQNNLFVQTFTLTVSGTNEPPRFTLSGDVLVDEDFSGTQVVNVTPAPPAPDETDEVITYSLSPESVSFVDIDFDPTTGTVNINAVPNATGQGVFQITANDGKAENSTFSQTFQIQVSPINDPPIFTTSGDINVLEDFQGFQRVEVSPATVPADEQNQLLTYRLEPASISFANVSINSSSGQVTFTSISDAFGQQEFTIIANDGQATNNLYSQTFTFTVRNQNEAPSFTIDTNQINETEDFPGSRTITLSPDAVPAEESGQQVTYSLSPASVDFANVQIDPASGNVSITAVADGNGSQNFTLTADDGQADNNTFTQSFVLNVTSVNDAPVISLTQDTVILKQDIPQPVTVVASLQAPPADEISQPLTYAITPANSNLVDIQLDNQTGKLVFVPKAGQAGEETFTLTVDDGQQENNQSSVSLTVIVIPPFTLHINAGGLAYTSQDGERNFVADSPDYFTGTSSTFANNIEILDTEDDALYQTNRIGANFGLSIPVENGVYDVVLHLAEIQGAQAGSNVFNVSVEDGAKTVSDLDIRSRVEANSALIEPLVNVTVTDGNLDINFTASSGVASVNAIEIWEDGLVTIYENTPPVFAVSGDVNVIENFTQTETVTVTPGQVPISEIGQVVTYTISPDLSTIANVNINSSTGEVTITSIVGQTGSQLFTITADDGQDENNTYSQSFTLTVAPLPTPVPTPLRINTGGEAYTTAEGIAFGADQFFAGTSNVLENTASIGGTRSDKLYQSERSGKIFSYDIPLAPGNYDVILHFAETFWSADNQRNFNATAEGIPVVQKYDIYADVGKDAAAVKLVKSVNVTDGILNLEFEALQHEAKINAIEIIANIAVDQRVSMRINSGSELDMVFGGQLFQADAHYSVNSEAYVNNNIEDVQETFYDNLFRTSRRSFTDFEDFEYSIPVDDGDYVVYLYFAETYWGVPGGAIGGVSRRVFDIELEGRPETLNLDLFQDHGPATAHYIKYNVNVSDGELHINLTPAVGKAIVAAIEVLTPEDESSSISQLPSFNGNFLEKEELSFDELSVFPNPTVDRAKLLMRGPVRGEFKLRVLDIQGKVVKESTLRKDDEVAKYWVSVEDLPEGIYKVQVTQFNFQSYTTIMKM